MKTILSVLDNRSARHVWWFSIGFVLLLGVVSALFNTRFLHEIFYVFPIIVTSWYGSKRSGIVLSTLAASLLLMIKAYQQSFQLILVYSYWLPCLLSFYALAVLITNFRNVHRVESVAADTDSLTGINNPRGFYAELANELLRSSRYDHRFSLAFLDIDDFKRVNDTLGHAEGDRLLKEVAACLKDTLRATDVVGRLGGDEFACLLPETGQNEASEAFSKLTGELKSRMARSNWKVGFSVGLVTFERLPEDVKEALRAADELMYSVKNSDKNSVAHRVWRNDQT